MTPSMPYPFRKPVRRSFAAAAAVAVAAAIVVAGAVAAHAGLVFAKPSPGSGLPQAPAAVVLKFTEPLNLSLSQIEVLDAGGADVGTGATQPVEGDPAAMQRDLGLLPVGQYTVRWTTVSSLDGHSLHGSYSFGVGTSAAPNEEVRESPVDSEGVLGLVGRFIGLMGLGLWLGIALLYKRATSAGLPTGAALAVARIAPATAVVGMSLVAVSSSLVATGSLGGVLGVFASGSGYLRGAVILAAAAGVVVGLRFQSLAIALAALAILAEGASGHAATSPFPILAAASFALHLAAVGVWLSAVLAALLSWPRLRETLAAVSPVAIAAAAVLGLSGVASAAFVLSDIGQLFSTDYGRILLLKSLAFAVMASLGLIHNLLRRNPAQPLWGIRVPVRYEALTGMFAVALAVLLVGFPNPPRESEGSAGLSLVDPVLEQLGDREAASLATASGPYLFGLTILPPEPGQVEFRLQILGVEPGDALRDVRISASGPATAEASLDPCGLGCFAGRGSLNGAGLWHLEASLTTNRGNVTVPFEVPLPTLDGTTELERAIASMEGLTSASLSEHLRAFDGGQDYPIEYEFEAPDRMWIASGTAERVVIGATQYNRQDGGDWQVQDWPGSPFMWPSAYYRDFWTNAAAIRLTGEGTVGDAPSRIVTFVRAEIPAWFRIWVGIDDGLVRRMEMRAEGHLMDQEWTLDTPVSIESPI